MSSFVGYWVLSWIPIALFGLLAFLQKSLGRVALAGLTIAKLYLVALTLQFLLNDRFGIIIYVVAVLAYILPLLLALGTAVFFLSQPRRAPWLWLLPPCVLALVQWLVSSIGLGNQLLYPSSLNSLVPDAMVEPLLLGAILTMCAERFRVRTRNAFVATVVVGACLLPLPRATDAARGSFRLAVIQTDFSEAIYQTEKGRDWVRARLVEAVEQAARGGVALVVLPESVAPGPGVYDDLELRAALAEISRQRSVGVLIGSDTRVAGEGWVNASFFFYHGQGPWGPYIKQKLVFGFEWAPEFLKSLVPEGLGLLRTLPWTEPFHLENPPITVQPVICFEMLNSIDSPSAPTVFAFQGSTLFDPQGLASNLLMTKAALASWKQGLTIAVAINSGPSAIFSQGQLLGYLAKGESGMLEREVRF